MPMDFFEQQDKARSKTKWLVLWFVVALFLIWFAIYFVCALVFTANESAHGRTSERSAISISLPDSWQDFWDPGLIAWVTLGVGVVVGTGAGIKAIQLSKGGSAVAEMLGGRPVNPGTNDPDERRLLNVVEEMAIASGTPVPDLYVLDQEPGINAFAAGTTPTNAAIAVTRGALETFNREELQAVIGHEFSHILNGDMRLNIRLMGILAGIIGLAIIGRIVLHGSVLRGHGGSAGGRDRGGGVPILLLGLALLIIGSIGVFFGKLIKSAVSRQREFLADAAAVQFTRNPSGMSSALKRIGGLLDGSQVNSPNAEEASHLFFGNALKGSWSRWFSTHPPLTERIRAIDPEFNGVFSMAEPPGKSARGSERQSETAEAEAFAGFAQGEDPRAAPATPLTPSQSQTEAESSEIPVHVDSVLPSIGSPNNRHLDYAAELMGSLPATIREAVRDPFGACAIVYCLLLSSEETVRDTQLQALKRQAIPAMLQEAQRLLPQVRQLPPQHKLSLIDLALPTLRELSSNQYDRFRSDIRALIEADEQMDLFEYVLEKVLRHHLDPEFGREKKRQLAHYHSVRGLIQECRILLSAMAHLGHKDAASINRAFNEGTQQLGLSHPQLQLLELKDCRLDQIDTALDTVSLATARVQKRILKALAYAVAADGLVRQKEAQLLRAIADHLGCPVPPFVKNA